ncbi:hypothetical protein Dda_1557 [Drechslerella dactyloides]|uniref:Uncharacterized protein n=1 Tax=Drechslerella dactyloides TaxID=74499 RepID=A0AAD6J3P1_DREDA|nr:hypothetical protein Dda_1557 [Drechslerella dactyloides]
MTFIRPHTIPSGSYSNEEIRAKMKLTTSTYQELHDLLFFLFCYHNTLAGLPLQPGLNDERGNYCKTITFYMVYLSQESQENFQGPLDEPEVAWLLFQMSLRIRQEYRKQKPGYLADLPPPLLTDLIDANLPGDEDFDMEKVGQKLYESGFYIDGDAVGEGGNAQDDSVAAVGESKETLELSDLADHGAPAPQDQIPGRPVSKTHNSEFPIYAEEQYPPHPPSRRSSTPGKVTTHFIALLVGIIFGIILGIILCMIFMVFPLYSHERIPSDRIFSTRLIQCMTQVRVKYHYQKPPVRPSDSIAATNVTPQQDRTSSP